jgi:integrase
MAGNGTAPSTSLQAILSRWLASYPERTQTQYLHAVYQLMEWVASWGGDPRLVLAISPATARDYAAHLRAKLSPATVRQRLAILSSLWGAAATELAERGLKIQNPWRAETIPRPSVPDRLPWRILSEEEISRMVAACSNVGERALILLLYHSGLRVSEACSARWEDVVREAEGWALRIVGKGQKVRVVGLSAACMRDLARLRRLRRGVDLATVGASLGHSDLRTTLRYLHARPAVVVTERLPGGARRITERTD